MNWIRKQKLSKKITTYHLELIRNAQKRKKKKKKSIDLWGSNVPVTVQ